MTPSLPTKRILIVTAVAALAALAAACAEDYGPRRVYVAGPSPYDRHVQWCFNHHPDYDPRTNLFLGRDGYTHPCRG